MFIVCCACAVGLFSSCNDDDDATIPFSQLPENAQTFLTTNFPAVQVTRVEKDSDGYDVRMANGYEVEFTKSGEFDHVDCGQDPVPQSILDLLPAPIAEYVDTNYPGQYIEEINKENFGYEIDLSGGTELEFDTTGNFLRVDN